ncbi:phosphonate ABC transporter, permease protein PhnE [Psychromonas sp. KJ10-10]|uniref:phosphonate ABC transporter, permease protein PhnE n=1 Tax=Psychromonas sp. KJ10-10 TaxID=3391823 RepID=UPI0039B5F640
MRTWQRPHYLVPNKHWRIALWLLFALYLLIGIGSVEVNWMRAYEGLERGARFLEGFLRPDFTSRATDIYAGILESLTITVTSTFAGILLSLPFGVGARRNISPKPIYLFCRAFIALSRSMQEIIVAIFLVALFGFGAFAGFLTLTYATIGFLGKLIAEEIEGIDRKQLEAITSTGASWLQRVHIAIWPQVMPRMVGLSFYRFDINFRESAVIGIVGAGGIGATLNTAIDRYEYDSAGAILILIIIIVMACEYLSGWIRKWIS